jgi:GNAT acetyltransferase-like protein
VKIPLAAVSEGLWEEWRALALSADAGHVSGHIFHHPAWVRGSLEAFPEAGAASSVYAIRRQNRLSTLGVFHFGSQRLPGLPVRLRMGRFLLQELADYNGFLSDRPDPSADIFALLDETRREESWDVLKLKDISCTDPLLGTLRHLRGHGYPHTLLEGNLCPYLSLEGTFEAYLDRKLGQGSRHIKKFRKVLGMEGFATLEEGDCPSGEFSIDELAEVEGESWKAATGLFSTPGKRLFYQKVLSRLHAEGRLQYLMCRVSGKPVAYVLGFYFRSKWLFYTTAYREAPHQTAFGTVASLLAIRKMFDLGKAEADFMRGAESSKFALTGPARRNYDLYLFASPYAKAAFDAACLLRRKVKQVLKGKRAYVWPGPIQTAAFPAFRNSA